MAESPSHTFTLVVFGGSVYDAALATNFVIIAKKLMADGLHPLCLSGIRLRDITNMSGPFLFGREDLRGEVQVYDGAEDTTPFYRVDTHAIKKHVMNWVGNVSDRISSGDRIIIVLIGHGQFQTGAVTLRPQHGTKEYLAKAELIAALNTIPPNVRLLVVNAACYSGAFVEEITTYPEGRISRYRSRIVDEILYIRPEQDSSTPVIIPSARGLNSTNISHSILSPTFTTAITNTSSEQHRHEDLLHSRSSARFWGRLRRLTGFERRPAQTFSDTTTIDMKATVIANYLEDLGSKRAAIGNNPIVNACQWALEGRGPPDLKDKVVSTIEWQARQMQRVSDLLEDLAQKEIITDMFDSEKARAVLGDQFEDNLQAVGDKFDNKLFNNMTDPPKDGRHVRIYFDGAEVWLLNILAYNRLVYPNFDLSRVAKEVNRVLA